MLDQVEAELPDHIDHQHLRLIRQGEDAVAPEPRQIGQAEFAVAVNGGGAQEIADPTTSARSGWRPAASAALTLSKRRTLRLARLATSSSAP
jgi:hypothetical protein